MNRKEKGEELDKDKDPEEDFKLIGAKFNKTLEDIRSKVD